MSFTKEFLVVISFYYVLRMIYKIITRGIQPLSNMYIFSCILNV